MTLQEFFAALLNTNMIVTVVEDSTELTKIYASGYEQLQSSLLAKTVSTINVVNNNNITIVLSTE